MQLFSWLHPRVTGRNHTKCAAARRPAWRFRPQLEVLEGRDMPSTYYAATASDLIADINTANKAGGANTIVLTAPTTSSYVLTGVNSGTDGATDLPLIARKDSLTVVGNGDTIDANHWGRLFDVASGASLTLQNVALENGYEYGGGASAEGGAIYNQGTLVLSGVRITGNAAVGSSGGTITAKNKTPPSGQDAAGGAIWSNGSLTVENQSVIQGNSATGGAGGYNYATQQYGPGGNAFGGGIYIARGTAQIISTTIGIYYPNAGYGIGNTAQGGNGWVPGSAYGGGLCVSAGTVTLNGDRLEANQALAGNVLPYGTAELVGQNGYGGGLCVAGGTVTLTYDLVDHNLAGIALSNGQGGIGYFGGRGGGIFIASGATVYLDTFTVNNTLYNSADSGDIDGTYTLQP
jgi:hypothetical protein